MAFLDLDGVRKAFATSVAVEGFTLGVERGEFVSFLGPSGCGKTTTLRMIAGFEFPTGGTIRLNGADLTRTPPNRRPVGMVFQSYALFPNMTVADNVGFGLRVARRSAEEIRKRVREMLEVIQLPDLAGRYPYQLSGGQQQRVALARALAVQPQVLLLDEPLSALDAKIRVTLRREIRSIQQQMGITTIYVTHDQEEALSLSDRVVVMNAGRVEQIGTPAEIYNHPASAFVAGFVGTLNLLTADVQDAAGGRLTVEDQPVQAAGPLPAGLGPTVSIALRPEMIAPSDAPDGRINSLAGTVADCTFLGSLVRVRVRVGGALLAFDQFNNPHLALPAIGSPITVTFSPEAVLILAR
jgi:putative spermidine/putrescine transport system ATP-binding protein